MKKIRFQLKGAQFHVLEQFLEAFLLQDIDEVRKSTGEFLVHATILELYKVVSARYRDGLYSGLFKDSLRAKMLTLSQPQAIAFFYVVSPYMADGSESTLLPIGRGSFEYTLLRELHDEIYRTYYF